MEGERDSREGGRGQPESGPSAFISPMSVLKELSL